jgi:hypothetical protein
MRLNDRSSFCKITKVVPSRIDSIRLRNTALEIIQLFSCSAQDANQLEQALAQLSSRGIPLSKINNNFWAKYVLNLELRNPEWDMA